MAKLTPKQEAFIREYLIDLNATQAAIRAGYSARNAGKIGPELLGKTRIATEIEKAKEKRAERTQIDADWVLSRLADEVNADVADLYWPEGGLKPIHEWPDIWRKGLVAGMDIEQKFIWEDGEKKPDGYVVKIKLSDRTRRIEMIGKHVDIQAFKDRVDVNVTGSLAARMEKARKRASS